jgi:hypothetical protein
MAKYERQTPYNIYRSILQTLSTDTDRISLVKSDQELILDGWEIHFAPDIYDLGDFCFPFDPENVLKDLKPNRVAEKSRLQNGRYEVMYNVTHKPILLESYEEELASFLRWARWSKLVVKESDFIDPLLSAFDIQTDGDPKEVRETLSKLTDKDMSSVLVVATNLASTGIKRLGEIVNKLAVHGSLDNKPGERPILRRRSEVVNIILDRFRQYFEDNKGHSRGEDLSQRGDDDNLAFRSQAKIDANNRRDAEAFDQLLQLNEIYNKEKHMILYFSSAPKSLYLDRSLELKEKYYPQINGKPYDLVRTATDLFVYMVYKGDAGETIPRTQSAKHRLNELEQLIKQIENIKEAFEEASATCKHCTIDIAQKRCDYGVLCDGVKRYGHYIEQREELNVNYSLQKRLAGILEKHQSRSAKNRYKEILMTLREVLDEKVKAKNQEMEVNLQSSINKADFLSTVVDSSNPKAELLLKIGGSSKRTRKEPKVSCYLNSYPVCLIIKNSQLKTIVREVLDLFEVAWDRRSFTGYVGEYLQLDIELNKQGQEHPESELVRCFLYLLMDQASKAMEIAEKYLKSTRIDEDVRQEFRYLLCFIFWKTGYLKKAINLASEGAELAPHSGKFLHCRSMIILSYVDQQPVQKSYSPNDMVKDTQKAIEEFSNDHDLPMQSDMLGVCHNNLAYYFSEPKFELVDVASAEEHLRELIKYIGEEKWDLYPEFYHTKGAVLYRKFFSALPANKKILDEAYTAAKRAYRLYPKKSEHGELVDLIKDTYERYDRYKMLGPQ